MANVMGNWIDGHDAATLRVSGVPLVQVWATGGKWVVMIGRENVGTARTMDAAKARAEQAVRGHMNKALAAYARGA